MPGFTAKYTPEQREAFATAALDRGIPARKVSEMAAAGELRGQDGAQLEPFDVPPNTVASERRKAKQRRMGKAVTQLAQAEPRDAIEALRRRLVSAADGMLREEERKPAAKRDPERMRQIGRCVREFAAIPGPKEAAKPSPGTKHNGQREKGATEGGLAGALLKAHRSQTATTGSGRPHHGQPTDPEQQNTGAPPAPTQDDATQDEDRQDEAPGTSARGMAGPSLVPAA